MDLTRWAIQEFLRFVLTAARVSGLFLVAPMLSQSSVPQRVKVGLSAVVALAVWPALPPGSGGLNVLGLSLAGYLVAMLGELAVGVAVGLVAAIVMAGVEMAGLFIGQQTGLAFANVLNPLSDTQESVMGQFYSFFVLVIFLFIGGHRMLVAAILRSFEALPLGGVRLSPDVAAGVVGLAGQIFVIAVTLSAPVVLALVLATIAMGLVARTVPQLNILAIGFPIRILLGWMIVLLSLAAVAVWSQDLFGRMFEDLAAVVDLMSRRG